MDWPPWGEVGPSTTRLTGLYFREGPGLADYTGPWRSTPTWLWLGAQYAKRSYVHAVQVDQSAWVWGSV